MICDKFKISNVPVRHAILPGPMCGIMDAPFREIISDFGTSMLTSEMMASYVTTLESKKDYFFKSIKKPNNKNIVYSVQIAGCDPDIVANAAKIIEDFGADTVDLNFGCPIKKVINQMSGSYLMKDVEHATKILEKTVKSVKIPVTLKMRMGWDFNTLTAPEIAKRAENLGIQMIVIHCRTRSQLYSGTADWSFAKQIKENSKIPIIINGDIQNLDDVKNAILASGCDGVMISRGLYGKPWLIEEIKRSLNNEEPLSFDKHEVIQKHIDLIFEHYNEMNAVNFSKKHLMFYSKGMENSNEIRQKISTSSAKNDIYEAVKFFS